MLPEARDCLSLESWRQIKDPVLRSVYCINIAEEGERSDVDNKSGSSNLSVKFRVLETGIVAREPIHRE